jgi:hypothetical protein
MYKTTSAAECAYLVARGHNVKEVVEQRSTRMKVFCFGPEAATAAPGFYSNEPIPAHDFHLALLAARKLIRQ